MADTGKALFVKVRVVFDGEAGSVPESVAAVMRKLGGSKIVHTRAPSGTLVYYAQVSSSDTTAVASLGELLTDAKNIGPETGLREIVIEVGRAADLPEPEL